jgi:2-polyprenyl-6-methoxyphenol hydroxylase-like FAD-dependent oxidoreductase
MSTILVLGGGIIGLSMAMMLARQGHYVTVFERYSEPKPYQQRALSNQFDCHSFLRDIK